MNSFKLILLFSLFIFQFKSNCSAQQVTFINGEDSSKVEVHVFIYHENKLIQKLKSTNGVVDFSSVNIGCFVEITANLFETKTFTMVDQLPKTISLLYRSKKIDEMVVTGQLQQVAINDAIQDVRIITAKKVEQMGAQNLTQLFKNELNIQLSQDGVLGSGMDLQGIKGENVKILIDGVPIIGRMNGTIDLNQINIRNIERIEIVEGPLSVNYGSDALAGTINIITKKNQEALIQTKAYAYYESVGTYNTQLNVSTKFKKTWLSADINRNYFDGWRFDEKPFHVEKVRIADSLRNKLFKPRMQVFGSLKLNQRINSEKHENGLFLSADIRLFNEEIENRGLPQKPYYIRAFDDDYRTFRWDNSISITGRIAEKWSIQSTNAYNYFKRTKNSYLNDLTTLNKVLLEASEQDTSNFDLILSRSSFVYNHSKKWQLETGYEFNYERAKSARIEKNNSVMGDVALFVTSEFNPLKWLMIKPGVRISYNSVFNSPVIPSIFFKFRASKNNDVRLSYSRGYRAPTLKELYFYFVDINHNIQGNSELKPETSHNLQASLRTDYETGGYRFVFTNQFYFNHLDHLVTLAQKTATTYSYINLFQAQTYGYTLNTFTSRKGLAIDLGFSLKARRTQINAHETPRAVSFYPEIKVNPSYTIDKINTSFSVFYKFTGKLPSLIIDGDGVVTETKRDAYHMLDATVTSFFWKRRIGLSLGVKNILNVTSIKGLSMGDGAHSAGSNSVLIDMGRTYFVSFTFDFQTKSKK